MKVSNSKLCSSGNKEEKIQNKDKGMEPWNWYLRLFTYIRTL